MFTFKQRYPAIYKIVVINHFSEPNDTPEHNLLQAKFLKTEFLVDLFKKYHNFSDFWGSKFVIGKPCFEVKGFDVVVEVEVYCKPSDEDKDEIAALYMQTKDVDDVIKYKNKHLDTYIIRKLYNNLFEDMIDREIKMFRQLWCIEVKPTISDDYPSVLRQVKANKQHVPYSSIMIYTNNYSGSVNLEDVKEIFSNDNILFIVDKGFY